MPTGLHHQMTALLVCSLVGVAWLGGVESAAALTVTAAACLSVMMATHLVGRAAAIVATLAVYGGAFAVGNALFGLAPRPMPAAVAGAGLVWLWIATRHGRRLTAWLALGGLVGLAAMFEWQALALGLLPAADGFRRRDEPPQPLQASRTSLPLIGGLAWVGAMATVLAVGRLSGWVDAVPRLDVPWPSDVADVLFSPSGGVLATSPALYVAAVGAVVLAVRAPRDGVPIALALTGYVWLAASLAGDHVLTRWDSGMPLFVPGMAVVVEGLRALIARRSWIPAGAVLGAAVVWNVTLMSAAHRGVYRLGETTSFRTLAADQARTLHAWIGHPFSYPASLWYAVRNRVSPGDYDLLWSGRFFAGERAAGGVVDVGDANDDAFIGDGWHGRESADGSSFRWASRDAVLLVPLDRPESLELALRVQAFTPPGVPSQSLVLETDTMRLTSVPVPGAWSVVRVPTPSDAWRTGVNRLHLRFSVATRPADVGVSGDPRALSAAVDSVAISRPGITGR